ncbi:UNVERIFIED_CONTAM: biotin operon repressor [Brevibacillus sp. OAP136]
MAEHVKVSPRFKRLCTQFGKILGGESEIDEGPVCFVMRMKNIRETILGRKTNSPLVQMQMFSFESLDKSGRALCLGETACHQNQVNRLMSNLRKRGIKVTAVHNHWLKENPRLMYMHWEAIENPIVFARKTKESIAFLG